MNSLHKLLASALALSTLAACGGGGDDDPAGAAAPAAAGPAGNQRYTQTDVNNVAGSGANILSILTSNGGMRGIDFLSASLQGLASDVGGTRVLNLSGACTTGTASASLTKAAVRTGLAAGDQVLLTFDKCQSGETLVSGSARLTARSTVAVRPAGEIEVRYEVKATGFSIGYRGVTVAHDGVADVQASETPRDGIFYIVTAMPDQKWGLNVTGQATAQITLASKTAFARIESGTPRLMTRKLDGYVTAGAPQQEYLITMPTAFSAPANSAGTFVPVDGTINTKQLAANLDTSTVVSGTKVTVNGDTDRNGSLDLVYTTNWAALTAP